MKKYLRWPIAFGLLILLLFSAYLTHMLPLAMHQENLEAQKEIAGEEEGDAGPGLEEQLRQRHEERRRAFLESNEREQLEREKLRSAIEIYAGQVEGLIGTPASALFPENFKDLTTRALEILPTREDVRRHPTPGHDVPWQLSLAGEFMAYLREVIQERPDLGPQALEFYQDCSRMEEVLVPMRALCLSHWIKGQDSEPDLSEYPKEVVNLAIQAMRL